MTGLANKLRKLSVFLQSFNDDDFEQISKDLTQLQFLSVSGHDLTDSGICRAAQNLTHLKGLRIYNGQKLTDTTTAYVATNLQSLEYLGLEEAPNISENGMKTVIDACTKLRMISCDIGPKYKIGPEYLDMVEKSVGIKTYRWEI